MAEDNVLTTPGIMDPSTEFGSLMQHAMKIKGAQMEQDRRRFEMWPSFFQNTMWMQGRVLELRAMPVSERLPAAMELKDHGNAHFREKKFGKAIEQYEQALGAFKYAKQLDPDWKKKGIRDETIEVVEEMGTGAERQRVVEFCVSCYNNLAACYLGRASSGKPDVGSSTDADYALCISACTAALELQPGCTKALYRRARARTEPLSAGAGAVDEAIADLAEAARHSPEDKAVRTALAKMRRDRAAQRVKESRTFSGMFGRGEIYDEKSLEEQMRRMQAEQRAKSDAEKKRTVEDCEREAREAEEIVRSLHARGKREDAEQLAAKIEEHRRQLGEYKLAASQREEARRQRAESKYIDFRNPTPEQVEDAKKHGIDLFDPLVVEELERLQHEKDNSGDGYSSSGENPDNSTASTGCYRRGTGPVRHRSRRSPPPDVSKIPMHEMRRRLDDMGVDYADCPDRPSLEQRLLAQYQRRDELADLDADPELTLDEDEFRDEGWGMYASLERWGCTLL